MEKLVSDFTTFINANWTKPLNNRSCIPRRTRKVVRDLLREYIKQAPPIQGDNPSSLPVNLFLKSYVDINPVYKSIFENNIWLLESAQNIRTFENITTVGRFLLMVVYRIMSGGIGEGKTIMDNYSQQTSKPVLNTQMDYFCYNFMWHVASVANYYKNKSLVIGLPMYWWRDDQNQLFVLEQLKKDFPDIDMPDARGAIDFVQYMTDVYDKKYEAQPRVNISFDKFNTNFVVSVPEFIMDGLCYTSWDKITKYGTAFNVDIFLTLNRYRGVNFKTVEHHKEGVVDGITRDGDNVDCSALRLVYHPGFGRRISSPQLSRQVPRSVEDTYSKQHDVNNKTPIIFTRNHENSGYYLDYQHYSTIENDIGNNERERRDRLTYNGCINHRFLGDIDNDKSTYRRMLRDRFMGYLDTKQEVPPKVGETGNDTPQCMDIDRLNDLIKPLEDLAKTNTCCSSKITGNGETTVVGSTTSSPVVREVDRWWGRHHNTSWLTRPLYRHYPYRYPLDSTWWRGRSGAIW
ncbi:A-type inclusion protein [Orf virus]|uniref:A-type inclusion protein n=1 Tax=Orf virus TaxID=10258 RepID=A0A088SP82_ORFV|nr:A-type inclusion protein [Orf virus]